MRKEHLSSNTAAELIGYSFADIRRSFYRVARPSVILGTLVILLAGYGYAALVPALDMDDLALNVYQDSGEFLRQGRFTTWLLQATTGIMRYQRFWPEVFAAVFLALAALLLVSILNLAAHRSASVFSSLLFVGAMCLWPYHAEILMFSSLCGMGLCFFLCATALAFSTGHISQGWRVGIPGALGAAVCLCFALGTYESFAAVWLSLVFAFLLLIAESDNISPLSIPRVVGMVIRGVWPLALAIVLRKGVSSLLALIFGVSGENTTSATSIYWFNRASVKDALLIFFREWANNYVALFFSVAAIALLDLACLALLIRLFRIRRGAGHVLLSFGLILSQFAIGILQGTGSQLARLTQSFAVFVPFVAWLVLEPYLRQTNWKRILALLLSVFILVIEGVSLNQTFLFNRARWHYEEGILQDVASQLDKLDPSRELPVAFCGELELSPELHDQALIPLNTPSYSAAYFISLALGGPLGELYRYGSPMTLVVNWAQVAFGTNEQMYILMDEIGRPCIPAGQQTQMAAENIAATLPDGSVTAQDGYLLVVF
ncbi:MAG TPA: glucosyltransferase domain-containing protein [Candidatus Fournierella merdigallinarum]|nr:glucosyltransferase domain-containing protein [Candidatus Fournierella merdigallinarum]